MKLKLKHHKLYCFMEEKTSVDDLLTYFHQSKKQRYLLYQQNQIQCNRRILHQNQELSPCDLLTISLKTNEHDEIAEDDQNIDIVYEDDIFLIVNKPAHLLVHPDGVNTEHTLYNRIKAYYQKTSKSCPVRAIHRLDKETSGLILFCKIPFFQPMLDAAIEEKKIHREYDAFIQGSLTKQKLTIDKPIAKDRHDARKMRISPNGKHAKTDIYRIQSFQDYTLVHCILHTGRTHQIRVHLSSIHHPLLSDPLYGKKDERISRLALHASKLIFTHPITQEEKVITCELPKDMKQLLR